MDGPSSRFAGYLSGRPPRGMVTGASASQNPAYKPTHRHLRRANVGPFGAEGPVWGPTVTHAAACLSPERLTSSLEQVTIVDSRWSGDRAVFHGEVWLVPTVRTSVV